MQRLPGEAAVTHDLPDFVVLGRLACWNAAGHELQFSTVWGQVPNIGTVPEPLHFTPYDIGVKLTGLKSTTRIS
ncbi:MAG: hypothetical protein ACYTGX_03475, partial [Planctomycetota bacterium]